MSQVPEYAIIACPIMSNLWTDASFSWVPCRHHPPPIGYHCGKQAEPACKEEDDPERRHIEHILPAGAMKACQQGQWRAV